MNILSVNAVKGNFVGAENQQNIKLKKLFSQMIHINNVIPLQHIYVAITLVRLWDLVQNALMMAGKDFLAHNSD